MIKTIPFILLLSSCQLLGVKSVDMSIEAKDRAAHIEMQSEDDVFQVHQKRPTATIGF